ncbi:putative lipase YDR444W isoform X2 [Gastrolobium bilobum]|uniref:putative lipase YDR444W isoform X2 n=1 Tax=Gastrolobium bilobum TaxID=150636 RepID=UPI002AB243F4|nr:putative lipase YDR444W isoform X2 [Gastrolobium bilobum]
MMYSFHSIGENRGQRHQNLRAQAMSATAQGKSIVRSTGKLNNDPDHLLVLVHGISASPSDWTYAEAELKRHLGKNFLIYASSSNTYGKTYTGIDEAGKRLADEVMQVVKKTRSLKRISFLAHSLGGLFARYAIAALYTPNSYNSGQPGDPANCMMENSQRTDFSRGMIAGLEPMNFVTLATPHLGVRGKKQLPFLLGVPILEKLAAPIAPFFVGRSGGQLFLSDGEPNKPSLLLRMASDCEDGKFISALGAFRFRIVYANVSYDHMVGWRTSSIRREIELCKPPRQSLDGYKHVVNVQHCPPVPSDGPQFPPEAVKAKETAQNTQNTVEFHEIMEEEMIRGLQQLGWKKVDVSFHSAFWPFFAHSNIHVKNEWLHNAGAGVIAHVADTIRQQETSSTLAASF